MSQMARVRIPACLLLAFPALLAGCATQQAKSPGNLQAGYLLQGRACPEVSALAPTSLRLGRDREVRLNTGSPCIETPAGVNEPAALLELPAGNSAYYVTVHTRKERLMLVPRVVLLDGNRHPLDTLSLADMKSRGNGMSATFFVRPGQRNPRYLLLYPDPKLIGDRRQSLNQGMDMGYYGFYSLAYGTAGKSTITYVEQGTLEISAVNYEPPELHSSG